MTQSATNLKTQQVQAAFQAILENMTPDDSQLRASLSRDPKFIKDISTQVVNKLLESGLVRDELLDVKETMALLNIKSRITMRRLMDDKKNPLKPVMISKNARYRYRLSDINKYMRKLEQLQETPHQ